MITFVMNNNNYLLIINKHSAADGITRTFIPIRLDKTSTFLFNKNFALDSNFT